MDNTTPPSSMAVANKTVFGSHVLTIDRYTKTTAALAVGETIQSDRFCVGGHSWYIKCCPRWKDEEGVEWVSVYLWLDHHSVGEGKDDDDEQVKASPEFMLLDRAGKAIQSRRSGYFIEFISTTTTRLDWGLDEFIQSKALESHLLIDDDDCCRIRCDITVIIREPEPPTVPPPSNLGGLLLASEFGRDVTFVVGGEHLTAHSCVLAARTSTAFMAEVLAGKQITGSRHVRVDGVKPRVFRALLHFIYTGSLEDEEGDFDVDARGLLKAAHRYGMETLKVVCADMLCSDIYATTALPLLELSKRHGCLKLNQACVEYISDMLNGYNMEKRNR